MRPGRPGAAANAPAGAHRRGPGHGRLCRGAGPDRRRHDHRRHAHHRAAAERRHARPAGLSPPRGRFRGRGPGGALRLQRAGPDGFDRLLLGCGGDQDRARDAEDRRGPTRPRGRRRQSLPPDVLRLQLPAAHRPAGRPPAGPGAAGHVGRRGGGHAPADGRRRAGPGAGGGAGRGAFLRRLPPGGPPPGGRRGVRRHGGGARGLRGLRRGDRLHQPARHRHPGQRPGRGPRGRPPVRRPDPGVVDQGGDRALAGRSRCDRGRGRRHLHPGRARAGQHRPAGCRTRRSPWPR